MREQGNIQASASYFSTLDVPTHSRILDIGTNIGSFVNQLDLGGYVNTVGIDVNEEAIDYGRKQHTHLSDRIFVYDGASIPFDDSYFDVVTMFDVIEHIPGLVTYLQEVKRVLRSNGLLVFQTPNKLINIPWEVIQYRSLSYWITYHCSLQTLTSLKNLLDDVGFTQIYVEKRSINSLYNINKTRRVLGPIGPLMLRILDMMPLQLFPNFWGHCRTPPE